MSESLDLYRAESAKLIGKLRSWLERLATSQTLCKQQYDFRRACLCRGALSIWWYSRLVLAHQICRTRRFFRFSLRFPTR